MIPPFAKNGALPPGIHKATLSEVADRFGKSSEIRRAQMESVGWMVDLARRANVQRNILNGSIATDIIEPYDVDCVLLLGVSGVDASAEAELLSGLPFLQISLLRPEDFRELVDRTFATDRQGIAKGMIEVVRWN